MAGFVKLDTGVLNSSIWIERDLRSVFITSLVMAEPFELRAPEPQLEVRSLEPTGWSVPAGWYGFVPAAGTGIVRRDGLEDIEAGLELLEKLCAPDLDSRSQNYDGRRMARINHGYIILNYFEFRDRDYAAADRMRRLRARRKAEAQSVTANVTPVTANVPPTEDREQRTEGKRQRSERTTTTTLAQRAAPDTDFEAVWALYPKRSGGNSRSDALRVFSARVRDGVPVADLRAGVERYASWCGATGKVGTETVMQATRFFGPGKYWEESWDIPAGEPSAAGRASTDNAEFVKASSRLQEIASFRDPVRGHSLSAEGWAIVTEKERSAIKIIGTIERVLTCKPDQWVFLVRDYLKAVRGAA